MSSKSTPRLRLRPRVRVTTGCFTCRGRKKKCDEEKPRCSGCVRNDLECRWPQDLDTDKRPRAERVREDCPNFLLVDNSRPECVADREEPPPEIFPSTQHQEQLFDDDPFLPGSVQSSPSTYNYEEHVSQGEPLAAGDASINCLPLATVDAPLDMWGLGISTRGMSLLPGYNHESFELLSHYLSRTATSMGNGSTDVNPFVVQLIPLAFSSDLILQLILAQSAAHRATSGDMGINKLSVAYYGRSLQLFRKDVEGYISGTDDNKMILAVGALVLCFTETTKGDINGAIFDHLAAARLLLVDSICRREPSIPDTLEAFIVEYFVYAQTLSMISTDARFNILPNLNPLVERKAQQLIATNYVGQLCGCWLRLLLLIPQIFDLGKRAISDATTGHNEPAFPSADDLALFASLHSDIVQFTPAPGVGREVSVAGRIFQQATLLYLLTAVQGMGSTPNGSHESMVQKALSTVLGYLEQLPATARINTSLCWPLAVIAACTENVGIQSLVRDRLRTMHLTIGLGNIQQTLNIVEHMWRRPRKERSPWTICRIMQEHQIWISFA
ncbi:hypothetical protein A1O3_05935 [Capronia epimyces CBS 606.96]|uniref:Zn(2)-C6 fungal-type domain-containing protein n=1 Tax=Capronia epimyces CBS 606.96 TaxID=1182542 RepID=W9Y6J9_9EURO|nr:uncharacterized protein A1O3_05935 [Capronia epimyces CBS 606.96]EXJ85260.1 hypothetical protein A1O3_05935 [Capronia epimyces CBS 606.96]